MYNPYKPVGASFQCYLDELVLLKCELMLLKCQINTSTKKLNGFLIPTKCLEWVLKYSIILNYQFPKTMFADFQVNFAPFLF